jgi:hypothetical protein
MNPQIHLVTVFAASPQGGNPAPFKAAGLAAPCGWIYRRAAMLAAV